MNSGQPQRRSKEARRTGTRARLLVAARQVIGERGVAGATSRHITDVAGANLAAITYHFGSKDELIAAALFEEIEQHVTPVLDALAADGEPISRMLTAVQALVAEFERQQGRLPLYVEAMAAAARGDAGAEPGGRLIALLRARLQSTLESLHDEGAIPGWVEPTAMAGLIVAVANGIALQTALDRDGPQAAAQAGQFAQLLLAARP